MMKKLLLFTCVLALEGMLLTSGLASAQTATMGSITGSVTDLVGKGISKATVTVKNMNKGAKTVTKTNAQGAFNFPFVEPGPYSIQAEAAGYQSYTTTANVDVGQVTEKYIKLDVAK